jgi:hypothetical protein
MLERSLAPVQMRLMEEVQVLRLALRDRLLKQH